MSKNSTTRALSVSRDKGKHFSYPKQSSSKSLRLDRKKGGAVLKMRLHSERDRFEN